MSTTRRKFAGTFNPRLIHALFEMIRSKFMREDMDSIACTSNSPDLVAEWCRRGLDVPCERVICTDRDGRETRPGRYSLTAADRRKVLQWLASRPKAGQ